MISFDSKQNDAVQSATYMRKKTRRLKLVKADSFLDFDEASLHQEKTACYHCQKVIEMYQGRFRTITFPSSEVKVCLTGLKYTKKECWSQSDVDYLVALY